MATMTVYFEDPFWIGVLELESNNCVHAVRHVFGGAPTDAELYQFLLFHGVELLDRAERSAPVPQEAAQPTTRGNPKRLARQAAKAAQTPRPSTAAQEAMRRDLESRGRKAAHSRRERHDEEAEHRREVLRSKARARHRGH